jgi:membrane dipeptidase
MIDYMQYCGDNINAVTRRGFLVSLMVSLAAACAGPTRTSSAKRERELLEEASNLYQRVSVDLISHPGSLAGRLAFAESAREPVAVLDHMRQGKLDAAVFAVVGDRPVLRRDPKSGRNRPFREPEPGELFRHTQSQLDELLKEGNLPVALSPADVIAFKRKGFPCVILSHEGADALEGNLSRVRLFYDRGLRVLQLLHNRVNELGDVQTEPSKHGGLTPVGRDVVREMNRLGMIIDLAHSSAATAQGVLAESRHPVIDSHTRPSALGQGARFRSDDEMRALAQRGGVVGVLPLAQKGETFDTFLKNIDHVKSVAGIDHVGIGTDLNGLGADTVVPTHKEFALIPAGLLARGYADGDVAKIIGGNFMRVFREVTENRG